LEAETAEHSSSTDMHATTIDAREETLPLALQNAPIHPATEQPRGKDTTELAGKISHAWTPVPWALWVG
jgi:hypothetical protein